MSDEQPHDELSVSARPDTDDDDDDAADDDDDTALTPVVLRFFERARMRV